MRIQQKTDQLNSVYVKIESNLVTLANILAIIARKQIKKLIN